MSKREFIQPLSPEQKRILEMRYTIFTDGSCDHCKRGGWAAIIIDSKNKKTALSGFCDNTTNNQMELTAIIEALEWVLNKYSTKDRKHVTILLQSDSQYCVNSIRDWMKEWSQEDFMVSEGKPRPNRELLIKLQDLISSCDLTANWIPRNSCENSRQADENCKKARMELIN